jgi:hypothetical protein
LKRRSAITTATTSDIADRAATVAHGRLRHLQQAGCLGWRLLPHASQLCRIHRLHTKAKPAVAKFHGGNSYR